jgi:hypothetical protein
MNARFIGIAALALSLSSGWLFAQTSTQLLQRGIYLQETAGDLDGAIQVYRQIAASTSNQPAIAAQAQFRLTQSLLQKVDFTGVGQEFQAFARKYPDQQSLVDAMGTRLRAIAEQGPVQLLGSFQGGVYHHYWTGVELTAPAGWTFQGQSARPDAWDRVDFVDGSSKATSAVVVMIRNNLPSEPSTYPVAYHIGGPVPEGWQVATSNGVTTAGLVPRAVGSARPANISDALQSRLKAKLNQRRDADGFHGYAYRPESIQTRTISGQLALSAVADYTDDKGAKASEYLTWVESEKTKTCFMVTAPASDFADVMARFEPIVSTAVIP